MNKRCKGEYTYGSITVETALILPIVFIFVMSLFTLGSVFKAKHDVQNALQESAISVAEKYFLTSYAAEKGYYGKDSNKRIDARNKLMMLLANSGAFQSVSQAVYYDKILLSKKLTDSEIEAWKELGKADSTFLLSAAEILIDSFYKGSINSTGMWLIKEELENNLDSELFSPERFGSYIGDKVSHGVDLLNIDETSILFDNQTLKFVIKYPFIIKLPVGSNIILHLKQTVEVRAWVSDTAIGTALSRTDESLWDLAPLQYGKIISNIELSAIDPKYPVGDIAYDVRSINIYAASYTDVQNFKYTIMDSVKDFAAMPLVNGKYPLEKILIIVVPEGKMNDSYWKKVDECRILAKAIDPNMKLDVREKYGKPTI